MSVTENINAIRKALPHGVKLCAVSKFHPVEKLQEAYDDGQRIFGESREQEVRQKYEVLPKDIEWHFIGHLQTNKVKYIAPFISMIESVDSERLLDEIQKQAARNGRTIDVLLELHVAQEDTKSGWMPGEVLEVMRKENLSRRWPDVRLRGVMGMASITDDETQIAREFQSLNEAYNDLLAVLAPQGITAETFNVRSWGMSHDWHVAVANGSTEVRIGTDIFGEREY